MMVSIKKQLLNLRFKLHLSNEGMVARNTRNRKQPEKYIPDYYFLWLSKTSMAFAMMPAKLMNKGTHGRADAIGMVMAQMSLKAALKK